MAAAGATMMPVFHPPRGFRFAPPLPAREQPIDDESTPAFKIILDVVPLVQSGTAQVGDHASQLASEPVDGPDATQATRNPHAELEAARIDCTSSAGSGKLAEVAAATSTVALAVPPHLSVSVSSDAFPEPPSPPSVHSVSTCASASTPPTSAASSFAPLPSHCASLQSTPPLQSSAALHTASEPPKEYAPYIRPSSPPFAFSGPLAANATSAAGPPHAKRDDQSTSLTIPSGFRAGAYLYSNTSLYQDYRNAIAFTSKLPSSIFHFACFPAQPLDVAQDRSGMADDPDEGALFDPTYGLQTTVEEIEQAKVLASAEEERMARIEARVQARRARNLALNPHLVKTAPAPAVIEAAPRVSRIVKPTAKAQALMRRPPRHSQLPQPRPLKNVALYSRFKRALAVSLFPDNVQQTRRFDFSTIPGSTDLLSLPPEYIPDPNPPPAPKAAASAAAAEIATLQVDTDIVSDLSPAIATAPPMSKSTSASASTSVFDSPATNRFLDVVGSPRVGLVTDDTPDLESPAIKSLLALSGVARHHALPAVDQRADHTPQPTSTQAQIPSWIHALNAAQGLDDWAASTTIDEQYAMEPAQPPQQPLIAPQPPTYPTHSIPRPATSPADVLSSVAATQAPNDLGLYNLTPSHDLADCGANASTSTLPIELSPAPSAPTGKVTKTNKGRTAAGKRSRASEDGSTAAKRKKVKEAPGLLIKSDDADTPSCFYTLQSTTCLSKRCDGEIRCFTCISRTNGRGCCFEGIRSFGTDAEGSRIEPGKIRNTHETDDSLYYGKPLSTSYTPEDGQWVRTTLAPHLVSILERELLHACNPDTRRIRSDAKKLHTCDSCLHSSLAGDWICNTCGRTSCHDCRVQLIEMDRIEDAGGPTDAAVALVTQTADQQRRKRCLGKKRGVCNPADSHRAESFTPVSWIDKGQLAVQLATIKAWEVSHPIVAAAEVVPSSSFSRFYPSSPLLPSERPTLAIPVGELTEDFFHQLWEAPEPLVIDGIDLHSIGTWSPQRLASQFADTQCELVNTKTQEVAPSLLSYFFGLYGHPKPDARTWKLKGFPGSAFEQLPELRAAYMEAVPLGDLLRPDGPRNLLSHTPSNTPQPEIGPISHFSWASRGSQMLHMEVTDVMNLMTWSSNTATGVPGSARYDVFHPQDAEALRTFLYEQLAKKSHKGLTTATYREIHDDPLLLGHLYLDPNLRHELYTRHKIAPYVVWQRPGQFVMIPAGCPYQVSNHDDCLNISHSFLSRESVGRSLQVYAQSRKQTKESSLWRADSVPLERQLWFSFKSVEALEHPGSMPSPPPVKRSRKIVKAKVEDVDWEP